MKIGKLAADDLATPELADRMFDVVLEHSGAAFQKMLHTGLLVYVIEIRKKMKAGK